jgi:hypothetical protein
MNCQKLGCLYGNKWFVIDYKGIQGGLILYKADSKLFSFLCVEAHVISNCPAIDIVNFRLQGGSSPRRVDHFKNCAVINKLEGGRDVGKSLIMTRKN